MTTAYDGGEPFDAITDAGSQAERLRGVVYPGVAALLLLGLGNLVAVLALALRESRHDTSILRAVGLTPRDTAWMVVWRQLALSLGGGRARHPDRARHLVARQRDGRQRRRSPTRHCRCCSPPAPSR